MQHNKGEGQNKTQQQTSYQKSRLTFKELLSELNNIKKHAKSVKVDLKEHDNKFYINVELPGVSIDDINIYVRDSKFLIISGNKHKDFKKDVNDIYTECNYGYFTRRVKVSSLINNKFDTSFVNGILYITLYKKDQKTMDYRLEEEEIKHPLVFEQPLAFEQSLVFEQPLEFSLLDNSNWGDDI